MKNDRVFDTLKYTDQAFTNSNSDIGLYGGLFVILYRYLYRRKIAKRGRYFYYNQFTARIARSGIIGNEAYFYSLDDKNAEKSPLTRDEIGRLNTFEKFVHRHRSVCFWLFVISTCLYSYTIFYFYTEYEILTPIFALPIFAVAIVIFFDAIIKSDGCSVKTLPEGVIAFGDDPFSKPTDD